MTQMARPEIKIAWPLKPPTNETSCNDGNRMSASPANAFTALNIAASKIAARKNEFFPAIKDAQLARYGFDFPAFSYGKCARACDRHFVSSESRLPLCVTFRKLDAMAEHTTSTLNKPDVALEMTLRPSLFSDFTGQPKVKERLEIAVSAAKQRGEALDHILLSGPPG